MLYNCVVHEVLCLLVELYTLSVVISCFYLNLLKFISKYQDKSWHNMFLSDNSLTSTSLFILIKKISIVKMTDVYHYMMNIQYFVIRFTVWKQINDWKFISLYWCTNFSSCVLVRCNMFETTDHHSRLPNAVWTILTPWPRYFCTVWILLILKSAFYAESIFARQVSDSITFTYPLAITTWRVFCKRIFIPHATSCGGYNVFDPSVSQSVSPSVLIFLLAQLWWNRSTEFPETL